MSTVMSEQLIEKRTALRDRCHAAAKSWWVDASGNPIKRDIGEILMLVVTELAEAVEGIRKDLMDDKLPHRKMEEVEMADAYIRIMDIAGKINLKFDGKEAGFGVETNKSSTILDICLAIASCKYGLENLERTIHQIENYCSEFKLDLFGAIDEKLAYNTTREDHKHEQRAKAGGKKF